MKRRTFLTSTLAAAAATLPIVDSGKDAQASSAVAPPRAGRNTVTWWGWGDPAMNPMMTARPGVSHNSRNDAVKTLYEKSHPSVTIETTA